MAVHSGIWFMILVLKAFYHSAQAVDERCKNVTCPEMLTCKFPKASIIIPDPNESCCEKLVCTCKGTENGKSSLSDSQRQYYNTQLRYTNCTLIDGNLELVGFHSYASVVDFTKHIEEVTGYVFIYQIYADYIDLSSLRLIRGSTKYIPPSGCDVINSSKAQNAKGDSLYVNSNYRSGSTEVGLKELRMQSLTEITEGNVSFVGNDLLCYVNTIAWEKDIFMSKQQSVSYSYSKKTAPKCQNCTSACKSCWGNTIELCQRITKSICEQCGEEDARCFIRESGKIQCCNGQCAAGCFGRGPKKCYACKNLNEKGECVKNCIPSETKDPITGEVEKNVKKYQYARYCIEKCPANVPQSNVFCQTFCEEGSFDYGNNICTKCNGGKCQNICYGLGLNHGPLKGQTYINANNIKHFNKNCTIIEGSLNFHRATFEGDDYCNVTKLDDTAFQVFENVEEITGFLVFETWRYPNICVFKNLRKIRGKVLQYQKYALAVYTGKSDLRELCFNSLNTIGNGGVDIRSNPMLCYAKTINWNLFKISQGVYQVPFSKVLNSRRVSCRDVYLKVSKKMCFVSKINWSLLFMLPSQRATVPKRKKCTAPCALQCNKNDGCWGKSNTQCIRCKDYTDLTDSSGKVAPLWINVNGGLYPGHNVTTCVEKCDFAKGVYASAEKTCLPCDPQCEHTCIGPGPTNCTKCKNKKLNDTCVEECDPENYFATKNNTCEPCGSGCIDGGCAGPLDEYNINTGCLACHFSYDAETNKYVYRGGQCNQCHATKIGKECQDGCYIVNNTLPYNCLILPGPNYGLMVGLPVALGIFIIGLCFIFYFYRNKKTMSLMKRTIEEKMTGEPNMEEEEGMPLTPSGATPNQAHLRIVKDSELVMGKLLGTGAFGAVHKAIWTPLNIQGEKIKIAVAVKTLKTPEEMTQSANNEIMDEAYVMASVSCGYLVRLLGIRMTEHVSLITQLMPLGSLLEYVRSSFNQETIHSRQMLTWFVQIAKGMQYLADKHLVHRDLAARNVLMKTPNHVKITDFGLAKLLDVKEETYHAEGGKLPIKWLAIECITQREFSSLSDVWAYGVTCWELLTYGSTPYEGVRAVEVLSLLERGDRLPQPSTATLNVYLLLVKCWMVDRRSRPTFKDLVTEFSKMVADPARYLVLQNDSCHGLLSPNPMDEDRFFRQLMDEEGDEAIIADEADQYLFTDNNHLQHPQPYYTNQAVVDKTKNTHPGPSGPERLFSRSTPSAHIDPLASSTSTERARSSDVDVARINSMSDQDDVFADSSQSSKNFNRSHLLADNSRKDSEETQRYTEDPTTKRLIDVTSNNQVTESTKSEFSYDQEQYLIPTPKKVPVYLDPEGLSGGATSLMNDTYVDSPPLSVAPSHSSDHDYSQLSNCRDHREPDYVNTGETFPPSWFSNEEYMATDSGIGEDSQSLLSRGNTGKRGARKESGRSSIGDNDQVIMKNSQVQFRPRRTDANDAANAKLLSTSSESSSPRSPETSMDNPEYMFLNTSTSNNKPYESSSTKPV